MASTEIREKAIECARAITRSCNKPCSECEYNEFWAVTTGASCLSIVGYEHGFADGVKAFSDWLDETVHVSDVSFWKLMEEFKEECNIPK